MNWLDYREALGIGFSDQDKVVFFLRKIFNFLTTASQDTQYSITEREYFTFCNMTGSQFHPISSFTNNAYQNILEVLQVNTQSLGSFLSYYVAFINCREVNDWKPSNRDMFIKILCTALQESQIPYDMLQDKDGVFVFPKGAKELDNALVSEPLEWLKAYPKSHQAFIKALKQYAEATPENASDVADKFRKALETFVQEFFGGARSLEKYITDHTYEQYLNQRGVPADMRDEFKNTVNAYAKFINNNAKHHDKTQLNVLEYLLYQTGNIVRFLITLRQEENANAD